MDITMSRRTMIKAGAVACGLIALGGAGKAFAGDGSLLRPPGGQDEDRFLGACIGCDRCRSVCPLGCIITGQLEDGLINVRKPLLDYNRSGCDFCGKCIEVCPTAALTPFDYRTQAVGVAAIDPERCLAFENGACRVCVDKCPYGALSLSASGQPVLDETRCNGCGICQKACPSNTYRSYAGGQHRAIRVVPNSQRSAAGVFEGVCEGSGQGQQLRYGHANGNN
ncbi:MAG: 4Fe-4S dicluster domain-containing protein [Coriobacteriales bacterium]